MPNILATIFVFLSFMSFTVSQTQSLSESVEYDFNNNRFLSGNDAVSMIQQDTSGNLSYFGQGLMSNLGIEIMGNYVFCIVAVNQTDPINNINVYDLTEETFVTSFTIDNAQVLNGMASDGVSRIWVTDFVDRSIYEIDFSDLMAPVSQQILSNSEITNQLNGITYDETQNRLVFVSWNDDIIRQIDLNDNSISIVLENTGITNMDGIDTDSNKNFYVSSWTPTSRITRFSNDFSSSEVLPIPGVLNPADICVAKEINILAIPSFQHNVILWPLEDISTSTSDLLNNKEIQIKTFPNPSSGTFNVELEVDWKQVNCQMYDPIGRLIWKGNFENTGNDQFQIVVANLQNGAYFLDLNIDQKISITKLVQIEND